MVASEEGSTVVPMDAPPTHNQFTHLRLKRPLVWSGVARNPCVKSRCAGGAKIESIRRILIASIAGKRFYALLLPDD